MSSSNLLAEEARFKQSISDKINLIRVNFCIKQLEIAYAHRLRVSRCYLNLYYLKKDNLKYLRRSLRHAKKSCDFFKKVHNIESWALSVIFISKIVEDNSHAFSILNIDLPEFNFNLILASKIIENMNIMESPYEEYQSIIDNKQLKNHNKQIEIISEMVRNIFLNYRSEVTH